MSTKSMPILEVTALNLAKMVTHSMQDPYMLPDSSRYKKMGVGQQGNNIMITNIYHIDLGRAG